MSQIVSTKTGRAPKPGSIIAKVGEFLMTKDGRGKPQTLTPVEAHVTFGTMRLASAIEELRNKYGLGVLTTIKRNPETGVEYASYSVEHFKKGDRVRVQAMERTKDSLGWDDDGMHIGDEGRITYPASSDGVVEVQLDSGNVYYFVESDLRRVFA